MWPFKKKKPVYSKQAIAYVLGELLRQTVDRETLRNTIDTTLQPIVGDAVLADFYVKLNKAEKVIDQKRAEYWIEKIEILRKAKVFKGKKQ